MEVVSERAIFMENVELSFRIVECSKRYVESDQKRVESTEDIQSVRKIRSQSKGK